MAGLKQPADKSHFLLPDLGEGLVEAELIRWLVKPGELVKESQPMAEMQTDKALVEVPSPWAGTISELCGKEGDIIKVAALLVRYGVGVASATKPATAPAKTAAKESAPACVSSQVAAGVKGSGDDLSKDQGTVVGSMQGTLNVASRFARKDDEHLATTTSTKTPQGKSLATPAVRRIAKELSIDINRVDGTGRGGRVTATDVGSFAGAAPSANKARTAAAGNGSTECSGGTDDRRG